MVGHDSHRTADMQSAATILWRAGWSFVVFGIADTTLMGICFWNGMSYKSSFSLVAVIAGLILKNGNLTAARVIAWYLAYQLSGAISAASILIPVMIHAQLF